MSQVIIIGGGAAGMMAAIAAAGAGHKVCIYEKNEKTKGCLQNFPKLPTNFAQPLSL